MLPLGESRYPPGKSFSCSLSLWERAGGRVFFLQAGSRRATKSDTPRLESDVDHSTLGSLWGRPEQRSVVATTEDMSDEGT